MLTSTQVNQVNIEPRVTKRYSAALPRLKFKQCFASWRAPPSCNGSVAIRRRLHFLEARPKWRRPPLFIARYGFKGVSLRRS